MESLLYVCGRLFVDFICCAKCWSRGWCCNECTKWCILGTSNVRTIPAILRILRLIRCHSNLFALDHLPVIHSIWFRGNRIGNILIWTRKIVMPSNILPFPITKNHTSRIGYGARKFHTWYCCVSHNFLGAACLCIHFLKLETSIIAINNEFDKKKCRLLEKLQFKSVAIETKQKKKN